MKVYTAITGDYDKPRDDVLCFGGTGKFKREVFNAKTYKVLSHQYIDADISIWIDGNVFLTVEPEVIVKEYLRDNDMAIFKHFARDCIYNEAIESASRYFKEPDIRTEIHNQADYYRDSGYPEHNGLYECNMIIRRHNKAVEQFNNAWWAEICVHSNRDQLSFPYVLDKFPKLKINVVESNIRNNKYFKYEPHV